MDSSVKYFLVTLVILLVIISGWSYTLINIKKREILKDDVIVQGTEVNNLSVTENDGGDFKITETDNTKIKLPKVSVQE